jgi:pullulanase
VLAVFSAAFVNGKEGMEHRIKKGVVGGIDYSADITTFGKDPEQVVTYVEAHDNHTLWDKLELNFIHKIT